MFFTTRTAVVFLCFLALTTATGALLGAQQGYEAQNATAATITYNGTHTQVGTEAPTNVTLDFENHTEGPVERRINETLPAVLTGGGPSMPGEQYVQAGVRSFARHTAHLTFTLAFGAADILATFTYHNKWLPQWLVSGVLQLAAYIPMGGVVVYELARVWRRYR